MTYPSAEIRRAGEKAGVPQWQLPDFVVNVHMKSQYLPVDAAIRSYIDEFYNTSSQHPTETLEDRDF